MNTGSLKKNDCVSSIAQAMLTNLRWEKENGAYFYCGKSNTQKPDKNNSQTNLSDLKNQLADCHLCDLGKKRTNMVFARGNENAELVFVGEGPGRDEDMTGIPFVGKAGKLLDKIIAAMGLTQDEIYICNIVKCRPPDNRVPLSAEMAKCGTFMEMQLKAVNPKIVVALGATAANYLLGTDGYLSKIKGRFHQRDQMKIMPTYHPAYLLRTPSAKREVWNHMQMVMKELGIKSKN